MSELSIIWFGIFIAYNGPMDLYQLRLGSPSAIDNLLQ